jgi:hypothetical protein
MTDQGCIVEFDYQLVIVQRICPHLDQFLAKGIQEGGTYRLLVDPMRTLVHDSDNLCKLWHKKMGHLHYGALPVLKDMEQRLSNFRIKKTREECVGVVHSISMPTLHSQAMSIGQERFLI